MIGSLWWVVELVVLGFLFLEQGSRQILTGLEKINNLRCMLAGISLLNLCVCISLVVLGSC